MPELVPRWPWASALHREPSWECASPSTAMSSQPSEPVPLQGPPPPLRPPLGDTARSGSAGSVCVCVLPASSQRTSHLLPKSVTHRAPAGPHLSSPASGPPAPPCGHPSWSLHPPGGLSSVLRDPPANRSEPSGGCRSTSHTGCLQDPAWDPGARIKLQSGTAGRASRTGAHRSQSKKPGLSGSQTWSVTQTPGPR